MAIAHVIHRPVRATLPAHVTDANEDTREDANIPALYLGDHAARTPADRLYPERNGQRCRIVYVTSHPSYPLVIEFEDGERGIAAFANVRPLDEEPS